MSPHREKFIRALEKWRTVPAEEQVSRMGALDPDREPERRMGRVRVGLWSPSLISGGAERWQESLVGAVDPARITWSGCCITGGVGASDTRTMARMRDRMPVSAGIDAARALAGRSDVVVTWSGQDAGRILEDAPVRPWTVYVAHMPPEAASQYGGPGPGGHDAYVAVSEIARESLPECHRAEATVISNALDIDRVKPTRPREQVRASWGIPEPSPVILFLGRLSLEKDPFAAVRLARSDPSVTVVLAGPPGAGTVAIRDREPANLRRVGPTDDVGSAIHAADWAIVPSWYESFGYTILESWAAGIPVIATPVGLAKIYPGLVRPIRIGASGEEIKQALDLDRNDIKATISRVKVAQKFAVSNFSRDKFGQTWTDYLCSFRKGEIRRSLELARARKECVDSTPDDGCGCSDHRLCRRGHGTNGFADRQTCRKCLEDRGVIEIEPRRKIKFSG